MPNPANIDDRNVSLGNYGISPNVTVVTEDTTLKPHETNVSAHIPDTGSITINFPHPSVCANRWIVVNCTVDGGGTSVIFGANVPNDQGALTAVDDFVLA